MNPYIEIKDDLLKVEVVVYNLLTKDKKNQKLLTLLHKINELDDFYNLQFRKELESENHQINSKPDDSIYKFEND